MSPDDVKAAKVSVVVGGAAVVLTSDGPFIEDAVLDTV